MARFVEMDERVKFKEQIEEKGIDGQVILINKFNVDPDKTEQFVKDWGEDAINFKKQSGFTTNKDIIKGLSGNDILTGSRGKDMFICRILEDTITDFDNIQRDTIPKKDCGNIDRIR